MVLHVYHVEPNLYSFGASIGLSLKLFRVKLAWTVLMVRAESIVVLVIPEFTDRFQFVDFLFNVSMTCN